MSDRRVIAQIKSIVMSPGQLLTRIPYTLFMLVILLVVAWATHSYFQELARSWINRLGFAPRDFWLFRWERLFLSAVTTNGGYIFWFALVMVAFTSGVIEWFSGTWRAIVAFWGIHLVSLMVESALLLLPLHRFGFPQARASLFSRDVGPSAGYMGSLGYVISFLPKPWRELAFIVILVFLVVSLFLTPRPGETMAVKLSADMAHLIAFPLGALMARLMEHKKSG